MKPATSPMPRIDTSDRPFGLPAEIVLDLPMPPSVNRLRKIDWEHAGVGRKWRQTADKFVMAAKVRAVDPVRLRKIERFELLVILSEQHTRQDLDNSLKCLIDYLRYIELIADDAQCNMRRLTVEWGYAPEGCRVIVRSCAP